MPTSGLVDSGLGKFKLAQA